MKILSKHPYGYHGDKPLTPDMIYRWNHTHQSNSMFRAVTERGEGVLCNAVSAPLKCGCKAIGNGSLQFPLTVKLCKRHKAKS